MSDKTMPIIERLRALCHCNRASSPCGAAEYCALDNEAADTIAALVSALELVRGYLDMNLGSPSWTGENPYSVIDAALAKAKTP